MKVLFVSSDSAAGGANISLLNMLNGLYDLVEPIVATSHNATLIRELSEMGVKSYIVNSGRGCGPIGSERKSDAINDFIVNYTAGIELCSIIKTEKIDLVHINSSVSNSGAIGAILAGIPFVWHFREILDKHFRFCYWDYNFKCDLVKSASRVITISECTKSAIDQAFSICSVNIYNGIDSSKYLKAINCKKYDDMNFILSGLVMTEKGQHDAIEAVKMLVDEGYNNIKLYIAGFCSQKIKWIIEKYVSEYKLENNIVLCGFKEDLSELRNVCSYALVTSHFEALGRVTVESMYSGNLVIGANSAGTLELIGEDEKRGLLYEEGNSMSLANTMKRAILLEKEEKTKILIEAQEFAMQQFDIYKYGEKLCDVYESILCENFNYDDIKKIIDDKKNDIDNNYADQTFIGRRDVSVVLNRWDDYLELEFLCGHTVAIYGMGEIGCKLFDELQKCNISISYVIDKDPFLLDKIYKVFDPSEEVECVDYLIVTVLNGTKEIIDRYGYLVDTRIISIEECLRFS